MRDTDHSESRLVDKKLVQQLHSQAGFDERFVELTRVHDTYEEAYEALEKEFKNIFGSRRYTGYDSYRKSRARRIEINSITAGR